MLARLYRYFYQQAGNLHDAEDLTAATFGKALASFRRYRPAEASFAAWVLGIARHVLADYWRARRLELALDTADERAASAGDDVDAEILHGERAQRLRQLIGGLPGDQRDALTLRFFAELSVPETARVLGKSQGAVKMLVHRAIVTLRGAYQEEEPC